MDPFHAVMPSAFPLKNECMCEYNKNGILQGGPLVKEPFSTVTHLIRIFVPRHIPLHDMLYLPEYRRHFIDWWSWCDFQNQPVSGLLEHLVQLKEPCIFT